MRIATLTSVGLTILLAACSAAPPRQQLVMDEHAVVLPIRADLFGPRLGVPPADQLHTLTEAQQAHFLAYFAHPAHATHKPHERIYRYLEDRVGDFRYYERTLTAAEALTQRQGNCLSLALVTMALAKLAAVDYGFQRTRNRPVYEHQQDFVVVADHVRTRLYDPTFEPGMDFQLRPSIVIDYFPTSGQRHGGRVSEGELLAMYYVNLAGEALVDGELSRSYWMLEAALSHAPNHPAALNSMAVLHRHAGDPRAAEAIFRHVLAIRGDAILPLGNLQSLLRNQGRLDEALALEARIQQLPDHDPYRLVEFGMQAYRDGHLQQALNYYARAGKAAPYMHEVYWRQATVYHAMGQGRRAETLLQQAVKLAPRTSDQDRYQAKLYALSRQSEN